MEPLSMFMLAMQASGAFAEISGAQTAKGVLREGRKLEHAGIEANMELARAQSAEESANALHALRQTLGSQIAVQAARGTASGAGSALFIQQESIGEYSKGERARRMKLLAQQAGLRASDVMSGLELYKSETQLGQQTTQNLGQLAQTFQTPGGTGFLNSKTKKKAG